MSIFVFSVVLFAAALHATWNAVVKAGTDKLLTTVLVMSWAAIFSAVAHMLRNGSSVSGG